MSISGCRAAHTEAAATRTSPPPTGTSAQAPAQAAFTTYTDPEDGYSLPILREWQLRPAPGGTVEFLDPAGTAPGEEHTVLGGVNILARYKGVPEYISALPNHSEPVRINDIITASGPGRIYMLRRDFGATTWLELHLYIPHNDIYYDIWLKATGDPEETNATLLHISKQFET